MDKLNKEFVLKVDEHFGLEEYLILRDIASLFTSLL